MLRDNAQEIRNKNRGNALTEIEHRASFNAVAVTATANMNEWNGRYIKLARQRQIRFLGTHPSMVKTFLATCACVRVEEVTDQPDANRSKLNLIPRKQQTQNKLKASKIQLTLFS